MVPAHTVLWNSAAKEIIYKYKCVSRQQRLRKAIHPQEGEQYSDSDGDGGTGFLRLDAVFRTSDAAAQSECWREGDDLAAAPRGKTSQNRCSFQTAEASAGRGRCSRTWVLQSRSCSGCITATQATEYTHTHTLAVRSVDAASRAMLFLDLYSCLHCRYTMKTSNIWAIYMKLCSKEKALLNCILFAMKGGYVEEELNHTFRFTTSYNKF